MSDTESSVCTHCEQDITRRTLADGALALSWEDDDGDIECTSNGIECDPCDGSGETEIECNECEGDGKIGDADCADCDGGGFNYENCDECGGNAELDGPHEPIGATT